MASHSQSLILVWRIAEAEARHRNASEIDTIYFVIALAKAVDVELSELIPSDTPERQATLEECLRELRRVRQVFSAVQIDTRDLRHRLRDRCAKDLPTGVADKFLHRTDAARAVFADAEAFADFAKANVFPIHLLYAVCIAPGKQISDVLQEVNTNVSRLRTAAKNEMLRGGRTIGSAVHLS